MSDDKRMDQAKAKSEQVRQWAAALLNGAARPTFAEGGVCPATSAPEREARPVALTQAEDGTPGVLMPVREGDTMESLDEAARALIYDVHPNVTGAEVPDRAAGEYEGRHRAPAAEVPGGPEAGSAHDVFQFPDPAEPGDAEGGGQSPAEELLGDAAAVVEQRGLMYDVNGAAIPERSLEQIAAYWSLYLGLDHPQWLAGSDVAAMMVLLKTARLERDHGVRDTWLDIAGYAALGHEAAQP